MKKVKVTKDELKVQPKFDENYEYALLVVNENGGEFIYFNTEEQNNIREEIESNSIKLTNGSILMILKDVDVETIPSFGVTTVTLPHLTKVVEAIQKQDSIAEKFYHDKKEE